MNEYEMRESIRVSLKEGAAGICLFKLNDMNATNWNILHEEISEFEFAQNNKKFLPKTK